MSKEALSACFLRELPESARTAFASLTDLEARLGRAVESSREAWPGLALDEVAFIAHLARHMASCEPEDGFAHLHASDLWLAFGCRTGDAASITAFGSHFKVDIDSAVRRFHTAALSEDDLRQALSEKLFVPKGERPPKIADYSGQGFLQNWVRITAVRTFTDMARSAQKRHEESDDALMQLADGDDLELSFLKKHYREEFKRAFETAVAGLDSRERNLLRQSVVNGLNVDQIAAIYHIHRATAARRVQKAREALLAATRQSLMQRLAIDRAELDSLMQLIQSRIDVSIHRVLGSKGDATE